MYQLIFMDRHESYISKDFGDLRIEKRIITLCKSLYLWHLLQLLGVGRFSPLKNAYSCQVGNLMHRLMNHIIKVELLPQCEAALTCQLLKQYQRKPPMRWHGSSDPKALLLKVDGQLHMLTQIVV
jgi:hypothetical protein